MTKGLTPQQREFVEYYLQSWNGTKAAIDAKYSAKTATEQASRLLTNVNIQALIQERLSDLKMSSDEVLVRLTEHARGSLRSFIRTSPDGELHGFDLSDDRPLNLLHKVTITKRTVKELTEEKVSIELYDAQAALALLGKHHKLFVERTEVTGANGGPIDVTSTAMDAAAKELETWRKQMSAELLNMPSAPPTPPTSSTDTE